MSNRKHYLEVDYNGRNLLEKHSLGEYGTWSVYGADTNCDMSGSHYTPLLGIYEGTLDEVIDVAVNLPQFWSWGGGEIKLNSIPIRKLS